MICAFVLAALTLAALQEETEERVPEVRLALLADRTHVVPGATFHLAVRLSIDTEHWHVYWENPGDSGLATEAKIGAPEGFEVGAVRFPAPTRFDVGGGLTTYGYEREVVLFVPVTAPAELTTDHVELTVEARWLVCKVACFLGDGEAALTLPVTHRAAEAKPANERLLERFRQRLPRPWSELEGVGATWHGSPGDPKLELRLRVERAEELEFFPHYTTALELAGQTTRRTDETASLHLTWHSHLDSEEPPGARGVLRVRRDGKDSFHTLDLPLVALPEPDPGR